MFWFCILRVYGLISSGGGLVLDGIRGGGAAVNDVIMQAAIGGLPVMGVGESGIGALKGFFFSSFLLLFILHLFLFPRSNELL